MQYDQANREHAALEQLPDMSVEVRYDYQYDKDGNFDPDRQPWIPKWMQGKWGKNSLARIVSLSMSTRFQYEDGYGVIVGEHRDCELRSLDFLSKFPKLRTLTLDLGMGPEFDFSALNKLSKLERFEFTSRKIEEQYSVSTVMPLPLSDIAHARKLNYLQIYGDVVPSDTPLKFQLRELDFRHRPQVVHQPILGLTGFGDLSKLNSLRLSFAGPDHFELETPSGMPALRRLNLTGPFKNLDAFSASPIEELRLNRCTSLKDATGISDSRTLRKLDITAWHTKGNKLDFLSASLRFPALEEASLSRAGTIDFLQHCTRLKSLNLFDFEVADLAPIEHLPDLRVLKLDCAKLKKVELELNQVRELTILAYQGLKQLRFLTNDNCRLEKLEILNKHGNVGPLSIEDLECLKHAQQLRSIKLLKLSIPDVDFLNGKQNLEEVTLMDNPNLANLDGLKDSKETLKKLKIQGNKAMLGN